MPDARDSIEPERFHAAVRAHVNEVVAGAGHHPGEAYTPAAFRHYVRRRALLSRLSEMTFSTVLDVGCAEGFFMRAIADRFGVKPWGVDISDAAAAAVVERHGLVAGAADAQRLPFADGAFDVVYSTEVIEHVLDPARMVRELQRVARRHVVVTTPITRPGHAEAPDFELRNEGHINSFDPETARRIFGPEATLGSFRCNATFAAIAAVGRHRGPRVRTAFYAADEHVARRLGDPGRRFPPLRNRDWLITLPGGGGPAGAPEWRCPSCHGALTPDGSVLRCAADGATFPVRAAGVPDFTRLTTPAGA